MTRDYVFTVTTPFDSIKHMVRATSEDNAWVAIFKFYPNHILSLLTADNPFLKG